MLAILEEFTCKYYLKYFFKIKKKQTHLHVICIPIHEYKASIETVKIMIVKVVQFRHTL